MAYHPPELGPAEAVTRVVFGCEPDDVAERVVLSPFLPLRSFARHLAPSPKELSPPFFYRGLTGTFGARRITVLLTGVGPSRVGDCLGFLALTPARHVIFAGAVGALAPGCSMGELFLPTEAADGEGYTRYADAGFASVLAGARRVAAPSGPAEELARFLARRGLTAAGGRVFTIGSIAFECPENLLRLREAGYAALEMELSAFYSGAARHGLAAAALTYVSDLPLESSLWSAKAPGEEEALRSAYRELPRLCLEYLAETEL